MSQIIHEYVVKYGILAPMTRPEEQHLVKQAQLDAQRFTALYLAFVDEIYRFIYFKTSVKETAEDLTAQVFMQALEHLTEFRYAPGARFSSWLYAIARNKVIDYYRRHKETVGLEDIAERSTPETATHHVDAQFQQQRIHVILQLLPSPDQEVLQLRLWQDKTYSEIAQIVQSNAVAVRARYSRALKKFKQFYLQHYGQTD
ncbi:MAG: hypothetical protein ACD_41C00110G0002 [uncultured bacterium]|nr:MAG: hypothetical protein ACD_41C00110G0002 [uncultured bacterium]